MAITGNPREVLNLPLGTAVRGVRMFLEKSVWTHCERGSSVVGAVGGEGLNRGFGSDQGRLRIEVLLFYTSFLGSAKTCAKTTNPAADFFFWAWNAGRKVKSCDLRINERQL